jgi:hypothetical protein
MRRIAGAVALIAWMGVAGIDPAGAEAEKLQSPLMRVADAAIDACFSRCARDNAACKSLCPATFGTPCLAACDSQNQMCRQSCQSR